MKKEQARAIADYQNRAKMFGEAADMVEKAISVEGQPPLPSEMTEDAQKAASILHLICETMLGASCRIEAVLKRGDEKEWKKFVNEAAQDVLDNGNEADVATMLSMMMMK